MPPAGAQEYPRIEEGEEYAGLLDEKRVAPPKLRISSARLMEIITEAVKSANRKASRAILNIPEKSSDEEMRRIYLREGRSLFNYFRQYCGDPPSTAYQCFNRHYADVAKEQFRNRTLQKERMNSGWRYQFMAHDCAQSSGRFLTVSQLATAEADFNVTIATKNFRKRKINIYVSVKNRTNTMGGQDWPKAIAALEAMAKNDQNRADPYLCVFGIAMERGTRYMKARRGGNYYSVNTEVWLSDFFWSFFSNHTYEEIMNAVLETLMKEGTQIETTTIGVTVPEDLIESFGACCRERKLIDESGRFHDPKRLVNFFCVT